MFFNDTNMLSLCFMWIPPMGRDFKDGSVLHSASIGVASVQDVSRPPSRDTSIVSETDNRKDKVRKVKAEKDMSKVKKQRAKKLKEEKPPKEKKHKEDPRKKRGLVNPEKQRRQIETDNIHLVDEEEIELELSWNQKELPVLGEETTMVSTTLKPVVFLDKSSQSILTCAIVLIAFATLAMM